MTTSTQPVAPPARPALPALTGLRFFAALAVAVYHLWRYDAWEAPGLVERVVGNGSVAVTLFFVLSGFILTYRYASSGVLSTTPVRFWQARLARIVPVYVLGLVVSFPVVMALAKRGGGDLSTEMLKGTAALAMVQAWWPDWALAWNPPSWSLSVEVFFYALFPLLLTTLQRLQARQLLLVGGALWGASVSLGAAYVALNPDGLSHHATHADHVFWWEALKYHPLVRLPEFIIGVIAGRVVVDSNGERPLLPAWSAAAALTLVAAAMAAPMPAALVHNGLLAPAFAVVMVALSTSTPPTGWGWLARTPWQRLGEASYALYIVHVPVFYYIAGIGERRTGQKVLENPKVAVLALGLAIALSLVVHRVVEEPLRRRLRPRSPA